MDLCFSENRGLRARDGVYHWHLQQAVPLHDAQGNVIKFVGTTTDIDEQKRVEESLAAVDRAKTTFFSNVSHEFRTPLTPMLGPLEEIQNEVPGTGRDQLTSGRHELLATVRRNGLRLLQARQLSARLLAYRSRPRADDLASADRLGKFHFRNRERVRFRNEERRAPGISQSSACPSPTRCMWIATCGKRLF